MQSRLILSAALGVAACGVASAQTVFMDQIGPNASFLQEDTSYASQHFGGGQTPLDIATIDNFSVAGPATVTNVQAAIRGVNSFTSYANVQSWDVDIFSSVAAAAASLTGDVGAATVAPGLVTLTTPFGTDANSALVSIPVSLALPTAGSYDVAVIPNLNQLPNGGQIEVFKSNYSGFPSDSNAFQTNPNGGFGFPGHVNPIGADAAYRVSGTFTSNPPVPEPGSLTLLALAALPLARRLRRSGSSA